MDLQPYSHDHFSKISRAFFAGRNQRIIVVFLQCTLKEKITVHSHKHSFTTFLSLSPYSQIDGMTDGETNTLSVRGLEELFSSCAVVSVFGFWQEIGFGVSYLRIQSTIQLWCCVSFLVLAGNSFWYYIQADRAYGTEISPRSFVISFVILLYAISYNICI